MRTELNWKVGQVWERRDGELTIINWSNSGGVTYTFLCDDGIRRNQDGSVYPAFTENQTHVADLVRCVSQHPDNLSVDRFAKTMKNKLAKAREKGLNKWADKNNCSSEDLIQMLINHLRKGNEGNFVDIANFCMMLHQRGEDPSELSGAITQLLDE